MHVTTGTQQAQGQWQIFCCVTVQRGLPALFLYQNMLLALTAGLMITSIAFIPDLKD
jgi:hypothetical protein